MAKSTYSETSKQEIEFAVKNFEKAMRRADGSAVDKVAAALNQFGWNKHIDGIKSNACREAVMRGLRLLSVSRKSAEKREKEQERRRLMDWIERGGPPDMYEDRYGNMSPQQLAMELPFEQYWVASQDRVIAKENIPLEPDTAAELRAQWLADLQRNEEESKGLRFHVWAFGRMSGFAQSGFAKAAE